MSQRAALARLHSSIALAGPRAQDHLDVLGALQVKDRFYGQGARERADAAEQQRRERLEIREQKDATKRDRPVPRDPSPRRGDLTPPSLGEEDPIPPSISGDGEFDPRQQTPEQRPPERETPRDDWTQESDAEDELPSDAALLQVSLPELLDPAKTAAPLEVRSASASLFDDLAVIAEPGDAESPGIPNLARLDLLFELSRTGQQARGLTLARMGGEFEDLPVGAVVRSLLGDAWNEDLQVTTVAIIDKYAADAGSAVEWHQDLDPEPRAAYATARDAAAVLIEGEIGRASGRQRSAADADADSATTRTTTDFSGGIDTRCRASLIRVPVDGEGEFAVFIESVTTVEPSRFGPDRSGQTISASSVVDSRLFDPVEWPSCHGFWNGMNPIDATDPRFTAIDSHIDSELQGQGRLIHEKVGEDQEDLLPLTLLHFRGDRQSRVAAALLQASATRRLWWRILSWVTSRSFETLARQGVPADEPRMTYRLVRTPAIIEHVAAELYGDARHPQPLDLDDGAIIVQQRQTGGPIEVRITKTLLLNKSNPLDLTTKGQTLAEFICASGWADQTLEFLEYCIRGTTSP
ncbi:MAG: hypothetical protein AAF567_26310 [Actinomycetota bacterium]